MSLPIHQILTRTGRSFLVEHGGVLTLVDTGWKGSERRILRALERNGRNPDDIKQILITHSHGDHAGQAKRMRELSGASITATAQDAEVMAGRAPYAFVPNAAARAAYRFLSKYERFEVDGTISERTEVDGGLIAIPAPGHTKGHMAVWAPELLALFAGDSVWNLGPLRLSWGPWTQDPERNKESVQMLAHLPSQALFFGHGGPVRSGGKDRLRSLLR